MTDNFDNIPSERLKVEVTYLVNTLNSMAGLYDSKKVSDAIYELRFQIHKMDGGYGKRGPM